MVFLTKTKAIIMKVQVYQYGLAATKLVRPGRSKYNQLLIC